MNAPGVTQHGRGDPKSPALAPDDEAVCDLCGETIDPEDVSVEAFEIVGALACTSCLETLAEQETHQ